MTDTTSETTTAAAAATATETTQKEVCALVCGHTGATGRALTALLLADKRVARVVTIGRHEYFVKNDKLRHVAISNVKEIAEVELPADVAGMELHAFWCLGTTRKDAGSAQRFREIDFGGAEAFIALCKKHNVNNFMLLSSTGASSSSWFLYMKTKGEIEDAARNAGFARVEIFRPGLLDRGDERRTNESLSLFFLSGLPAKKLAMAMLRSAFAEGDVKGDSEQKTEGGSHVTVYANKQIYLMAEQFEKDHPDVAAAEVPSRPAPVAATATTTTEEHAEESKTEAKAETPSEQKEQQQQ